MLMFLKHNTSLPVHNKQMKGLDRIACQHPETKCLYVFVLKEYNLTEIDISRANKGGVFQKDFRIHQNKKVLQTF